MAGAVQASDAVVLFNDGTREAVHIGIREIVGIERRWPGNYKTVTHPDGTVEHTQEGIPQLECTLYGAWLALSRPGGDFDAWLDTVASLEEVEAQPSDPSEPAPGAGE